MPFPRKRFLLPALAAAAAAVVRWQARWNAAPTHWQVRVRHRQGFHIVSVVHLALLGSRQRVLERRPVARVAERVAATNGSDPAAAGVNGEFTEAVAEAAALAVSLNADADAARRRREDTDRLAGAR